MTLDWRDLSNGRALAFTGRTVQLTGWLPRLGLDGRRALLAEPPCCRGCPAETAAPGVTVAQAVPLPSGVVTLEGTLQQRGTRWHLEGARPVGTFGRRRLLEAAPLLCLAAAAQAPDPMRSVADATTVDLHSHAAKLLYV